MEIASFFDIVNNSTFDKIFKRFSIIEILSDLDKIIRMLPKSEMKNTYISSSAIIGKNVYIGNNCKIYDYANVRDNSIILDNTIVGHCSEVIRSIIFNGTIISHKNTIGGSIIGSNVNIGSNVCIVSTKLKNSNFFEMNNTVFLFDAENSQIDTQMTKFGSVVGDSCRIGSNVCINPGSSIGKNTIIYPNISLPSGFYKPNCSVKTDQRILIDYH